MQTVFAQSFFFLSEQDTFTKPIQLTSAEVPCFESTEDCAQHCFKNKWTLVLSNYEMKMGHFFGPSQNTPTPCSFCVFLILLLLYQVLRQLQT